MKKIRTKQDSSPHGISTFPVSKKPDPETSGIGALLRKKEKRILSYLKCRIVAKKVTLSSLALLVSFTVFIQFLPQARITSISAEAETTYVMNVDLNEYYQDTLDSSYYAWRGKVNLTGRISVSEVSGDSIVVYLDQSLTPVFEIDTSLASIVDSKYNFTTLVDTTKYARGYHTLRVYNGTIASPGAKTPILTVPVYFEYSEIATILNIGVGTTCNMREAATTSSNSTTVSYGTVVDVLNEVKGDYVAAYGTDIWYQVRFEENNTIRTGYILSYFFTKMTTGISKMNVTATDTGIEEFLSGKTTYELNLVFSSYDLSVKDLVLYNKGDTLKVFLNGVETAPPYTSLPLATGVNKVEFVSTSASFPTPVTYTYNIWRIAESTEAEFQSQLARFPGSYKPALRALHSKYPDWLFNAFNTNLDWGSVVSMHDSGNMSLIEISTLPEYKYANEILDGTSFVRASRAAVEYYMDPRNFFGEGTIFQFEQLTYQPAMHTLDGIKKLLSGSGLVDANVPGIADMFLQAGIDSGVSPYHLAARSRQEVSVGAGLSAIATGMYTGGGNLYYRYYNFYNIGTGSSPDSNLLIQRGLTFAMGTNTKYNLPWNSAEKAIVGGGIYIGENYINKGQDTLYLQKFDVDPINGLYKHEYMQNVRAPYYEAQGAYRAYSLTDSLTDSFVFRIPVYLNMPLLTSPKPEDTNKLNTLGVTGYTLSPVYNSNSDGVYHVTVPTTTEKITITATTLNSNAVIVGTGEKSLLIGDENTFAVTCTPSNGETRTYTIQVTRSIPDSFYNNLLSALTITTGSTGIALSPAFVAGQAGPFTATVPDTVQAVTIGATPQNGSAVVTGSGEVSLSYGSNTVTVNVTAESGAVRTYTIQIPRSIPKVSSGTYVLSDGIISGIPLLTTAGAFKAAMNATATTLKLSSPDGTVLVDSAPIGTGTILRVYFGSTLMEEHTILIYGDNNGDGKVNATDYAALKIHILKLKLLTGIYLAASNINKDKKVDATDYAIIKIHILKLKEISQK